MPVVTGTLWDAGVGHLAGKQPELLFTLNQPNMSSPDVYVTPAVSVTPASSGAFSVTLADTFAMAYDAFYTLKVRFQNPGRPGEFSWAEYDLPDWKIRVPGGGGPIGGVVDKPPTNQRFVYVSLTAPPSPTPFLMWLQMDPINPDNPASTGNLYEWRNV